MKCWDSEAGRWVNTRTTEAKPVITPEKTKRNKEIRAKYATGRYSMYALGKEYNISTVRIRQIVRPR